MQKLFLVLLLLAASAHAEWTLTAVANKPERRIFVDLETIRPSAGYLRVWTMYDVDNAESAPDGVTFKSAKQLEEFDCMRGLRRVLAVGRASGNMGSGRIVPSELAEPPDWRPHRPQSMNEITAQVICDLDAYLAQPETWQEMGETDGMSIFIDLSRFRRVGSLATVRMMFDLATARPTTGGGPAFRSMVFVSEYDCEKRVHRNVSMVTRADRGWKGQVTQILAAPEAPFKAYAPDDGLAGAVCDIGK